MSNVIKQFSKLETIKMILFMVLTVGGIIMVITSMFTHDWNVGTTGLLALILSHLNDIENKLDKLEKDSE